MARRRAFTVLDAGGDVDRVTQLLDGYGEVQRNGPDRVAHRVHLDSFDWRVRRAGGALSWSDGTLTWRDRVSGRRRTVRQDDLPRWPRDITAGPIHDLVADACDVRILLPRAEIDLLVRRYRVLDDLDGTVGRIDLAGGSVDDGTAVAILVVRGVRGSGREHADLVHRLAEALDVPRVDADPDDIVYAAAGLEPGGYTGKLRVPLEPAMAANQAIARVCRHLVDMMRVNEEGVIADLDTEFLHDFRVAVRRTRSLLSATKRVLPREVRDNIGRRFRWLGDLTTPVRDLDVLSLAIPDHVEVAGHGDPTVLQPLVDLVVADRDEAHATLVEALTSKAHADLLHDWSDVLDTLPTDEGTIEAPDPIVDVARQRIWRAYRVVRREGRAIDEDAPGERLHQLRKDAKNLRYLLEAFGPLFDADGTRFAVTELKLLQDDLGAFQDGEVQSQKLRDLARRVARRPTNVATVMAIGVLAHRLEQPQHDARMRFPERFARFDAPDNRALYTRLFSPKVER